MYKTLPCRDKAQCERMAVCPYSHFVETTEGPGQAESEKSDRLETGSRFRGSKSPKKFGLVKLLSEIRRYG